jgi:hypothetical protein
VTVVVVDVVVVGAGGRVVVGAGGRVVGVTGFVVVVVAPPSSRRLRGVSDGVVVIGDVVLGAVGAAGRVVVADDEGDPTLVVRPVNEGEAGTVWNCRTPTRPRAVPTMTKGARFIAFLQSLERKLLNMNSISVHG